MSRLRCGGTTVTVTHVQDKVIPLEMSGLRCGRFAIVASASVAVTSSRSK